ncbi:hypothetical protein CYCD_24930 [Tenuifilaceae bacterium CYCD]|nr:hypothetical protein CYCD_24930 [Tenuifilaceae bacterium CYCD]
MKSFIRLFYVLVVLVVLVGFTTTVDSQNANFRFNPNFGGAGSSLCISKNNRLAAIYNLHTGIEIWDLATNKQIAINKVDYFKKIVGFTDDGQKLLYTRFFLNNLPDSVYMWDIKQNAVKSTKALKNDILLEKTLNNGCIVINDSIIGKDLIFEGNEILNFYPLYDIVNNKQVKLLKIGNSSNIQTSRNGKWLSFLDLNSNLTIQSINDQSVKGRIKIPYKSYNINASATSNTGRYYAYMERIYKSNQDTLFIADLNSSNKKYALAFKGLVKDLVFDDNDEFLFIIEDNNLYALNLSSGERKLVYSSNSIDLGLYVTDKNYCICDNQNTKIFNIKTGNLEKVIGQSIRADVYPTIACQAGGYRSLLPTDSMLIYWDFQNLQHQVLLTQSKVDNKPISEAVLSNDGQSFFVKDVTGKVFYFDISPLKLKSTFKAESNITLGNVTKDNKYLPLFSNSEGISFYDFKTWIKAFEVKLSDSMWLSYTPMVDLTKIIAPTINMSTWNSKIEVFEYGTGKRLYTANLGQYKYIKEMASSPDKKHFVVFDTDNIIHVFDYNTGAKIFETNLSTIGLNRLKLFFSDDSKVLVGLESTGIKHYWNVKNGKALESNTSIKYDEFLKNQPKVSLVQNAPFLEVYDQLGTNLICKIMNAGKDWLCFTPDGYFESSNLGGQLVTMVNDCKGYGIDQFAVQKNRPDIIIKRLGCTDNQLIEHYHKQYLKRLKKINLNEKDTISELNFPEAEIASSTINSNNISLNITFKDSKYSLTKYHIYVNDIPVYGVNGKNINGKSVTVSETVPLSNGSNKIEASCVNEKGVESYRAMLYTNYKGQAKGSLYLLAFGVSKYNNPKLNLQYADKDALDLSKVIENYKGKGFTNVYTKVLTNEQVTPDAIKASKDFVKSAKPDDTFILFIAGHGMHDSDPEATYYYLTYNTDLKDLKGTAANFETIEDLLQGIPPRNKLFLMDACESGEIDEETFENLSGFQNLKGLGIASRGFKTTSSQSTNNEQRTTKRNYLYQKDRYIYNDLVRRSGAIVFSSSKGGELSYERSDIENGLFTEYIMKALTTTEADKDGNGIVSTDELREYVSAQVAKASGDLQHPTVDRDNIYQKFGFGIK